MRVLLFIVIVFSGCSSTKVSVSNSMISKDKRIGLSVLNIAGQGKGNFKDSVCTCIGQSIVEAIAPYLRECGYRVYNVDPYQVFHDSLVRRVTVRDVDQVMTGSGMVHRTGKSTFVDNLAVRIVDVQSGEILASASFSGVSSRPVKSGRKVGAALKTKIQAAH